MAWRRPRPEAPEYVEGQSYKASELEAMADEMLRSFAKREYCRECLGDNIENLGEETGYIQSTPQFKDGEPILDEEGNHLFLDFPELQCSKGHSWFKGEGKARGHKGDAAILLEEHLIQRKRREIHSAEGVVDPNIVSGMYWRIHKDGRPQNDATQRSRGAGFYKAHYFLPIIWWVSYVWMF